MAIETLIARYGFVAIFFGAGIEGETSVITGGVLANHGLLSWWSAAAAAVAGSFVADQLFFLAGRHFRDHPRIKRIAEKPGFAKALATLDRHPTGFILVFRFLYGLRTVSPIAVGTSHVATRTFMILNLIAAAVWGVLFTGIGYAFGEELEALLHRFVPAKHLLLAIAGLVVAAFLLFQAGRWLLGRRRAKRAPVRPTPQL